MNDTDSALQKQRELQALALKIAQAPEIAQARERAKQLFLDAAEAKTRSGQASLQRALDQHVYAAAQRVTNADPQRPEVLVVSQYLHELDGEEFPAALHGGLENPDNVYRIIQIDGESHYELHGFRHRPEPAQVTYDLMDSVPGVRSIGNQVAMLKDVQMQLAPDGSFKITIDPEPANGRPNHLRTTPETRALMIRDTLSDWWKQTHDRLRIVRLGTPSTPERSERELIEEAAKLVVSFTKFWIDFRVQHLKENSHRRVNVLDVPEVRPGGWGFISNTAFSIDDDEALLVTVHPTQARYHSILLGDPWWVGMESGAHLGSLNTTQARLNADGTYTYVIALRDPGVYNWLDTEGLNEGFIQVRWQGLSPSVTSAADAIRGTRRVKLAELKSVLPAETVWVTAEQRSAQLADRHASYRRRLG